MAGRILDLGLHLLDRQVVDPKGHLVCNVDDLELAVPEDGGAPYVTAILAGPEAIAPRLGGLLGRWASAVHHRLHPSEHPPPARVDFGVVTEVGSQIDIALECEQTQARLFEDWCRDNVVAKIPGSEHASE